MSSRVFICVLTEHPGRPNFFGPKVLRELRGNIPRNAYVVIPAHKERPVAIGLMDLTDQQAATFDAMPGVWVFDVIDWRRRLVSSLPAATRQRLEALLSDRGINAGIVLQDTRMQAIAKIVTAIGEDPQALLARYRDQAGVEL